MEQHETVTVFSFRVFDSDSGDMRLATCKAPREVIVSHFHGEVLEGTDHRVPKAELDEHGRYRRIATGWGELS